MSENKVKLPKDVAEAIEALRELKNGFHWKDENLLNTNEFVDFTKKPNIPSTHKAFPIAKYIQEGELVNYVKAIVNGYEVELSPKEKAISYLIKYRILRNGWSAHNVVADIIDILNEKKIKI